MPPTDHFGSGLMARIDNQKYNPNVISIFLKDSK
jgi:hypothetical protein